MRKTSYTKWLIASVICFGLALFLEIGAFTFLRNIPVPLTNASGYDPAFYLTFSADHASVGVPLKVKARGSQAKNVTYNWTVGKKTVAKDTDSYTPTKADLESFITVTATSGAKQAAASLYFSELPVIYINTTLPSVEDTYFPASMTMQGNDAFTANNTQFYAGDIQIKLRGNSTRYRQKAPYKIRLDKECDLFHMGKSRHWVLLANDIDHTLIRNKLVYDFSAGLGASFAAESLNVVLILNNDYRGVYQFCEQVRIDEGRVDVFDWSDLADEAAGMISKYKKEAGKWTREETKAYEERLATELMFNLGWISSPHTVEFEGDTLVISDFVTIPEPTGGVLLEMDFYHSNDTGGLKTNFQQPFYFNSPIAGYTNKALQSYMRNYLQTFEYALHSEDHVYHEKALHEVGIGYWFDWNEGWIGENKPTRYSDPDRDGMHYTELFDVDSLINNFLVCEFTMNWDSMKNSVFVSKDLDGLAEMNPVWDFDWAFGNRNMYWIETNFPTGWHTLNDYFTNEQYYQSQQWNRYLIKDPYFLKLVYDKYKEIRPTLIEDMIKKDGLLDQSRKELRRAAAANDRKWQQTYTEYGGKPFSESMDDLKTFINTRVDWLDSQFATFNTLMRSLNYDTMKRPVNVYSVTWNDDGTVTIDAYVQDTAAKKIVFQVNGTTFETQPVSSRHAKCTLDASLLNSQGDNIVEIHGTDTSGNYLEGFSNYSVF